MGKLSSLDSSYKKELIDRDENKALSVVKQCNLINYNRSNLFYAPMVNLYYPNKSRQLFQKSNSLNTCYPMLHFH
ncbi:hypothetical protein [Sulfurimonas sp.]|uniref:hypothetical protein n=1 Tax=Sulfurimonas sp. TaxID=2022749 RepID=UPI002B490347|nr:hypothetical protein [Sulfurimonas sp.]